jgi:hypothetical protein
MSCDDFTGRALALVVMVDFEATSAHPSQRRRVTAAEVAGTVQVVKQSGHVMTFRAAWPAPVPASTSPIRVNMNSSTVMTGMP